MGFLVSQHGQWGAIPPPPFLSISPLESMRSGGAIPPPQKGYLSDTCAIPYENKANGCDTPLCDTISKGYCAIRGGISHWAAKPGVYCGKACRIDFLYVCSWHFPSRSPKAGSASPKVSHKRVFTLIRWQPGARTLVFAACELFFLAANFGRQ